MIEAVAIDFSANKKKILEEVHFRAAPGELVGIVGRNGAGKSTLLKILCGYQNPSRGCVRFCQEDLHSLSPRALAKKRSVLSQEIAVRFELTVLDVLLMGRHPYLPLRKADFQIVDELVKDFHLQSLMDTPYVSLSGGEKQRVQFVRALAQLMPLASELPKYLFLDEPLSALDLSLQQSTLNYLRNLSRERNLGVIMVIHDLNNVSHFCDKVYLLETGRLQIAGSPLQVFTRENLKRYFGVDAQVLVSEDKKPTMIYNKGIN